MTQPNRVRMSRLSIALIAALAASSAFAQSTSAGIGGHVVGAGGQPVAGAEVSITHVESGTVSRATTDASGNYSARGLRVGGPYTIVVDKAGTGSSKRDDIYLGLDKVQEVDVDLAGATTLDTVTVVAARIPEAFQSDNKGIGTNVSSRDLQNTPMPDRSIQNVARLDPRIVISDRDRGAISAVGQNNRYNSITVDSVNAGDPFGLNDNGLPTLGSPISMDSIEEFNLSTANYDVSTRRGVGANINAVTKSGTNDFHGSAYYSYQNADQMIGGGLSHSTWAGYDRQWTGGVALGGPIVKDKLFFFANYEKSIKVAPGGQWGPEGSGQANIVQGLTQADVDQIVGVAESKGLHPGSYDDAPGANLEDKRSLAKLDWNINDFHRASLTYSRTEEFQPIITNSFSDKLVLSSGYYFNNTDNKSYALHFYDDWSENFSTEASFSSAKFHKDRGPLTGGFQPDVTVATEFGGPEVQFGTEFSTQANILDVKTRNAAFSGTWYLGDHNLKAGVDYQQDKFYNLFLQNLVGSYVFDSIEDFTNGDYFSYRLAQPAEGYTLDDVAARFELKQFGYFAQDTWQVNDKLSLQYGLRFDVPKMPADPVYNPCFSAPVGAAGVGNYGVCENVASTVAGRASGGFGYANNTTIDGNSVLQPRVSFNYQFDTERLTQLRGGAGLFISNSPGVWIGNPYSGNGVSVASYFINSDPRPPFSSDPFDQNVPANSTVPGAGGSKMRVDTVDPEFKLPTVWKFSVGFDHQLPWWDVVFSAEYEYLKARDAIFYQNINLVPNPNGTLPDGRLSFYKDLYLSPSDRSNTRQYYGNQSYDTVTRLSNTDKGWSDNLTLMLKKAFSDDWSGSLGFSAGRSKDVNSGTSSVAYSNFKYRAWVNPNDEVLATSNYSVPFRALASLTWKHNFFGSNATSFSAFFDGHSGTPYSWIYGNDINGDGESRDLFYIPASIDDVQWSSRVTDAMKQQFMDYFNSDDYLKDHKGQIAERNGGRAPWVNQLDISVRQEFPGFAEGHKTELRLDIFNFTNMINRRWGVEYRADFPLTRQLADGSGVDPVTGDYIYDISGSKYQRDGEYHPANLKPNEFNNPSQRWSALLTLRYSF
jgi:hypothetical protein